MVEAGARARRCLDLGEVSGVAADTPDRIIVAVWGDRNRQNQERPDGTNYLVVANRNGDIIECWQQWDAILNKPHHVYISPYGLRATRLDRRTRRRPQRPDDHPEVHE